MAETDPGITGNPGKADPDEASSEWQPPRISLKWQPYFRPDATDEQLKVQTVTAALDGGLITKRQAVEKIAPIFGIEAIDAALEALEEEAAEKQSKDLEAAHAFAKMNADANEGASGLGGGKDAPGTAGQRGGGGPPTAPKPPGSAFGKPAAK